MRLRCAACGAFAARSETWCAACGVDGAMLPTGAESRSAPAAPATLEHASAQRFYGAEGELGRAFGGKVPERGLVVVAGSAGSGKTTLALDLLLRLGRASLWLDAEMSEEQCRDYVERLGFAAALSTLPRVGALPWADALEHVEAVRPDVVLVDSLQRFARHRRARESFVQALRDLPALVLLISHVNAHGGLVGGTGPEHDGDALVWISKTRIAVEKSRWGPSGSTARTPHVDHAAVGTA